MRKVKRISTWSKSRQGDCNDDIERKDAYNMVFKVKRVIVCKLAQKEFLIS